MRRKTSLRTPATSHSWSGRTLPVSAVVRYNVTIMQTMVCMVGSLYASTIREGMSLGSSVITSARAVRVRVASLGLVLHQV